MNRSVSIRSRPAGSAPPRASVVVADPGGHPADAREAMTWPSRNASWPSGRGHVDGLARVGQAQLEDRQPVSARRRGQTLDRAEVDLGLVARRMAGARSTTARCPSRARGGLADVPPRTVDSATSARYSSTRRSQTRRAVWRCLRGAARSSVSQARIVARCGPIAGAGRVGVLRGGGSAAARAWRTVRRWTRWRRARARIDRPFLPVLAADTLELAPPSTTPSPSLRWPRKTSRA